MPGKLEASVYEGGTHLDLYFTPALTILVKERDFTETPRLTTDTTWDVGSNLSAGQRQLISLARALLTPTNILGMYHAPTFTPLTPRRLSLATR